MLDEDKTYSEKSIDISEYDNTNVDINEEQENKKARNNFFADTDSVIKIAVCMLAFLALLFSVMFWFMKSESNTILFALFSCGISIYGFYLAYSKLK